MSENRNIGFFAQEYNILLFKFIFLQRVENQIFFTLQFLGQAPNILEFEF